MRSTDSDLRQNAHGQHEGYESVRSIHELAWPAQDVGTEHEPILTSMELGQQTIQNPIQKAQEEEVQEEVDEPTGHG